MYDSLIETENVENFDPTSTNIEYIPVIYYKTFGLLMKRICPDLYENEKKLGPQIQYIYEALTETKLKNIDKGIKRKQWENIDQYINLDVKKNIQKSEKKKLQKFLEVKHNILNRLGSVGLKSSKNEENDVKESKPLTPKATTLRTLSTEEIRSKCDKCLKKTYQNYS